MLFMGRGFMHIIDGFFGVVIGLALGRYSVGGGLFPHQPGSAWP